jgi:hypothetical protein
MLTDMLEISESTLYEQNIFFEVPFTKRALTLASILVPLRKARGRYCLIRTMIWQVK